MGLDSSWQLPEGTTVEFDPGLSTLTFGDGRHLTMFRGKLYEGFFQKEVGVSLYDDMDTETVQSVAETLLDIEWEERFADTHRAPGSPEQFRDLQRMFQGYAAAGAWLRVWY